VEREEPRRLGDVLSEVLKSAGITRRDELRELSEAWCRAAGPEAAGRSRVVSLKNGTLTVTVGSPALRQELETFRRAEVLRKMQAAFPARRIAALRCVLT
jgi:predicted nucleic acid-binding Zn ribbon protein